MPVDTARLTVDQIRADLETGRFSAEELARAALRFAEEENPKTNACLLFSAERAYGAARRVDQARATAGRFFGR